MGWGFHGKNPEPKRVHALTYFGMLIVVVIWIATVWVTTFKPF